MNRVLAHTGVEFPIVQAPMGLIARSQLASAVSNAGGLGVIETSSGEVEACLGEIARMRELTDKPFGVNLPLLFIREPRIVDLVARSGVTFVTTSAGSPAKLLPTLKANGLIVYHVVPNLSSALKAVDAGVDGLIVEGAESAGLRNPEEVHTFALLQAVREKVDVPIVAAGGIVDGRGMAAAFALGAEGVTMGTRFVASFESPVHLNYKQAIVAAPITGTALTDNPPRARSRGLRTPYATEVAEGKRERLPRDATLDMLYVNGDVDNTSGAAGESAGLIHELKSVRQIIDDTIASFWREIDRLARLRPPSVIPSGAERSEA